MKKKDKISNITDGEQEKTWPGEILKQLLFVQNNFILSLLQ